MIVDTLFGNTERGALISHCEKYRYRLWRIWDSTLPCCMFVMHNPSTADADIDDPTIRRCIGFAKSWGYGGMYVGNLSPYRATNPADLHKVEFSKLIPDQNVNELVAMAHKCEVVILAYGNPVLNLQLELPVSFLLRCREVCALKLTKAGNPCHPLYLPKTLKPFRIQFKLPKLQKDGTK